MRLPCPLPLNNYSPLSSIILLLLRLLKNEDFNSIYFAMLGRRFRKILFQVNVPRCPVLPATHYSAYDCKTLSTFRFVRTLSLRDGV